MLTDCKITYKIDSDTLEKCEGKLISIKRLTKEEINAMVANYYATGNSFKAAEFFNNNKIYITYENNYGNICTKYIGEDTTSITYEGITYEQSDLTDDIIKKMNIYISNKTVNDILSKLD